MHTYKAMHLFVNKKEVLIKKTFDLINFFVRDRYGEPCL